MKNESRSYKQTRSALDTRTRAMTPAHVAAEERFRAAERKPSDNPHKGTLEHLEHLPDLHDHLVSIGHPEACEGIYNCDPWKYEPVLFEELMAERASGTDEEHVNKLRGWIRAGSWMKYERTDEEAALKELKDLQHLKEFEVMATRRLTLVKTHEEKDWNRRKLDTRSDPDTLKEVTEDSKKSIEELKTVERALHGQLVGPELEEAVRIVESLNAHVWTKLKQQLAYNGISWQDAKSAGETRNDLQMVKTLVREIEDLRPLRDFLYFRRLYPNWGKIQTAGKRAA